MNRQWIISILLICTIAGAGYAQGISDPEGTVRLRLSDRNEGETSFYPGDITSDDIRMTSSHNLTSEKGLWEFVNVGRREGLGYIQKIPTVGWAKTIGVAPKNGYVARIQKGWGNFGAAYEYVGIYCEDWITSTTDAILGARIKYVCPFFPTVSADSQRLFEDYTAVDDQQLAYWYLKQADKNGDGIISDNEARAVTSLGGISYGCKPSTVVALNQFPNLESLRMDEHVFQPMDLLILTHRNLKELYIDYVRIDYLDLSSCNKLQKITIDHGSLKKLILPESVVDLHCPWSLLTELDLSHCKNLKRLIVFENRLSELDVSGLSELEILSCGDNNLSSLDVSKNKNLKRLYCASNNFEVLDISQNPNIEVLECVSKTAKDKIKTIYIPASKTKRDYKLSSGALTWFTGINVINK